MNVQYCATAGTECAELCYSRYWMCSTALQQVLNVQLCATVLNVQNCATAGTECAVLRYSRYWTSSAVEVLHSATKYFNTFLKASYIHRINFYLQHSKFWMWLSFLWSFKFEISKPHFVHLTGRFISWHWQLLRSCSVNVRWMNGCGASVE